MIMEPDPFEEVQLEKPAFERLKWGKRPFSFGRKNLRSNYVPPPLRHFPMQPVKVIDGSGAIE